ncbi:uncharacterized protein LOC129731900 [Wyeomyia smithii]|uniref:uncharacterized protein LOC129731900 n=1 Tax=Wyeomyia smithii TaxID=174621 RepID=UPI002467E11E|nr:uncharacterized protein LOC129731900 [Wyeomyia smithii]
METKLFVTCLIIITYLTVGSCFFYQPAAFTEKITDIQDFASNVSENRLPLRILEHTITPYDMNPEQLKLIGRYVFLAPQENNLYLVGFEETIDKSDAARRIISELVKKKSITSIYKSQRAKSIRVDKIKYL